MYAQALTRRLPIDAMRKELTPGFVDKPPLPKKGDRVIYWDERQPGLGLVVTERGHKSWCVQYRNRAGKTRRMAPPAPGKLSLDKARAWAKRITGAVMDGRDPLDEERKARASASNTFKAVAEKFLEVEGRGCAAPANDASCLSVTSTPPSVTSRSLRSRRATSFRCLIGFARTAASALLA
jgi:Arm DNA-binding domain